VGGADSPHEVAAYRPGSVSPNGGQHVNRTATALAALAVALVALAGCGSSQEAATPPPAAPAADPHGVDLPDDARVVLLSRAALPPSPAGDLLNARLESGSMPTGERAATVLTDSDCTPDAAGVSHCRNELRLGDGTVVVARHSHRMAEVPCLSPGEEVLVRPV
jgi:hypothetical protein